MPECNTALKNLRAFFILILIGEIGINYGTIFKAERLLISSRIIILKNE